MSPSENNQFHTGKNGEVPIRDANGAVDKDHSSEIRETPRSYAALGPTETNDSVFQGAAEEPLAEGAISRPTSQASIRLNEVSSKLTYGKVHPSMLDVIVNTNKHTYHYHFCIASYAGFSCNWRGQL